MWGFKSPPSDTSGDTTQVGSRRDSLVKRVAIQTQAQPCAHLGKYRCQRTQLFAHFADLGEHDGGLLGALNNKG